MLKRILNYFKKDKSKMSPQQRLVNFCQRKAELLNCPEYFIEKDAVDIHSWSTKLAKKIISKIDYNSDENMCPWCLKSRIKRHTCDHCSYGSIHGICKDCWSIYQKISGLGNTPIYCKLNKNIPELKQILKD